jgi:hypothetical protein
MLKWTSDVPSVDSSTSLAASYLLACHVPYGSLRSGRLACRASKEWYSSPPDSLMGSADAKSAKKSNERRDDIVRM